MSEQESIPVYKNPNWFTFLKINAKEVSIGLTVLFFGAYLVKVMFLE